MNLNGFSLLETIIYSKRVPFILRKKMLRDKILIIIT